MYVVHVFLCNFFSAELRAKHVKLYTNLNLNVTLLYKMANANTTKAQVKTAAMVCLEALLHRSVSHMHNHTSEKPGSPASPCPEITICSKVN